jgi:hypothetical protein
MTEEVDLGSIPREVLVLVAAIAVAIAVLQAMVAAWGRFARRRRMSVRMERAVIGERRAAAWLEDRGYVILGSQVAVEHPVRIDERVVVIALRADYVVEKGGARYVVEVKTGALAPRIETSATRRQMLEYRIAFDVDGVVLLDAETGGVHEVTFPALERWSRNAAPSRVWPVAFATAVVFAAVTAVLLVR